MLYADKPLPDFLPGSLNQVDGGVTVSLPDGSVLSVQPDGSYQTRPAGTAGPYEVARVSGNFLIYTPGDKAYAVAMVA